MSLRRKRRQRSTLPQLPAPAPDETPEAATPAPERPGRVLHVLTTPENENEETVHGALDLFPAEVAADSGVHVETTPGILSVKRQEADERPIVVVPIVEPMPRIVRRSIYGPRRRSSRRPRRFDARRAAAAGLVLGTSAIILFVLVQSRLEQTSEGGDVLLVDHAAVTELPLRPAIVPNRAGVSFRAAASRAAAARAAKPAVAPPPRNVRAAVRPPAPASPPAARRSAQPSGSRASAARRAETPAPSRPAPSRAGTSRAQPAPPRAAIEPPPRATAPPAAVERAIGTPAARSSNDAVPLAARETAAIRSVLARYASAFSDLDVEAVSALWPGADTAALDRAFRGLAEQALAFNACDISVTVGAAAASCRGTVRYVTKIGRRSARTERRVWQFSLRKAGEGWLISRVETH